MPGFVASVTLFAQAPKGAEAVVRDPRMWVATAGLVLVLLAGALALFIVDRWRKRQFTDADAAQESAESLTSFRALYERGELSKEEYERVRTKMAAKIKQEVAGGYPSAGRPAVRPAPGSAGSNGTAGGGEFDPGADSPTGPGTGSSDS